MSLLPIQQIAAIAGTNRETVKKRADQLGLLPTDGEKGAKLYDTRKLLRLVEERQRNESITGGESLEEAKIRQTLADAEVKELTAKKLKGQLASVTDLLEAQNAILDKIAAIIKKSSMSDDDKEDALSAMSEAGRFWEEEP
jgi:hypothetical protein